MSSIKNYFHRILYAIAGKNYLPPHAYWEFPAYLDEILPEVLEYHITHKDGYPPVYGSMEVYTKRITKLQKLLKYCSTNPYNFNAERRKSYMIGELIPYLWI